MNGATDAAEEEVAKSLSQNRVGRGGQAHFAPKTPQNGSSAEFVGRMSFVGSSNMRFFRNSRANEWIRLLNHIWKGISGVGVDVAPRPRGTTVVAARNSPKIKPFRGAKGDKTAELFPDGS